jgi:predicted nucleic acid-binding protein
VRTVFADTLYWVAIFKTGDQWTEPAKRAKASLGNVLLLTTDEVLTEFLTALSKGGNSLRSIAVKAVRAILDNPNIRVIPQSRDSFFRGLSLYEQRYDKEYSLTDCISMNAMRYESVSEVLTNDNHFAQEGFTVLINR